MSEITLDVDLRAMRDLPRIPGAMRRGLVAVLVRNGLFHTAIPRQAWTAREADLAVRCNCGIEHPLSAVPGTPENAPCGRWFLFDGTDVRVATRPSSE